MRSKVAYRTDEEREEEREEGGVALHNLHVL